VGKCFVLNQERKDIRIYRIMRKGKIVLNQERKDIRIYRILLIFKSFLSWFKTKETIRLPYSSSSTP